MKRYRMLVLSRPAAGREAEYNQWYQDVHLGELVAIDGIVSAQRYRMAGQLAQGEAWPYAAVYEIETDDLERVLGAIRSRAQGGQLTMSAALDTSSVYAVAYEMCGPAVGAPAA